LTIYLYLALSLQLYFILPFSIGISIIFIFIQISKYIPKFIWIGILGWILLTAEIIPGMIGYDLQAQSNLGMETTAPKEISMDIENYLGDQIIYINFSEIENISELLKKSFIGIFHFTGIGVDYSIFVILFFVSLIPFFYSTFSNSPKIIFNKINRKYLVFSSILVLFISAIYVFLQTEIYFIPLSLGLFGINVAVVYWEITDRGINPCPFLRSVNFTLVSQLLTANIGMIIYIAIFPLFKGVYLTNRDIITFIWIIISGSSLSVFMALISQIIWSGKRLTEKYEQ
jgi:hypothetical protein